MTVATDQSAFDHIREAQILIDLGEYDKSITYLDIISQRYKGNNKEVEARLLGGLARNYLNLGLNRNAVQFWENAIQIIDDSDSKDRLYLKAVFRNNMSLAFINLDETEKAQENLLQSLEDYPLIETYQKLSELVLNKNKNFELSNFYLSSGLAVLNNPEIKLRHLGDETYFRELNRAYIIEGYAYHNYVKEDFKTSLEYYLKVLSIAEELKRVGLRIKILKKLGYFYQENGDSENSTRYFTKYIQLNDSLRVIKNNSLSIPMQHFLEKKKEAPKKQVNENKLYIILLFTFISIALLFATYRFRKRKKDLQPRKILNNEDTNSNKGKPSETILSTKTAEEILLKLKEFESSNQFLDKNMSFTRLVAYLNSNTKYLRQVLKNNKNTDYNNYINKLRIQYIVNKLKTNPEYLNYKISFLADESGFSSHSKFSADFKRIVGLSPSEFIDNLKN